MEHDDRQPNGIAGFPGRKAVTHPSGAVPNCTLYLHLEVNQADLFL